MMPNPRSQTGSGSQSKQVKVPPGFDPTKNPKLQKTLSDAVSYLDAVRSALEDKPEEYDKFIGIMADFKNQKVDVLGSMKRIADLFQVYPELITGYNVFLPPGYRIEFTENAPRMITPDSSASA